jgi:hypothetical protein
VHQLIGIEKRDGRLAVTLRVEGAHATSTRMVDPSSSNTEQTRH